MVRKVVAAAREKMAEVHGNRTHQRRLSEPLNGFEDRAEHQSRFTSATSAAGASVAYPADFAYEKRPPWGKITSPCEMKAPPGFPYHL